MTIITMSLINH